MNTGTKLRTVLAMATVINDATIAAGVSGFENPTVDMIYKILSFAATAIVLFINTYYNNDYTVAGMIGTDITRKLKEDGTMVVEVVDGDEDDDDEPDPEENEDGDEVLDPYEGDESGEVEH